MITEDVAYQALVNDSRERDWILGGGDEHWDGTESPHARLEDEIADVHAALTFLIRKNSTLDASRMGTRTLRKLALFNQWHEQHRAEVPS